MTPEFKSASRDLQTVARKLEILRAEYNGAIRLAGDSAKWTPRQTRQIATIELKCDRAQAEYLRIERRLDALDINA